MFTSKKIITLDARIQKLDNKIDQFDRSIMALEHAIEDLPRNHPQRKVLKASLVLLNAELHGLEALHEELTERLDEMEMA